MSVCSISVQKKAECHKLKRGVESEVKRAQRRGVEKMSTSANALYLWFERGISSSFSRRALFYSTTDPYKQDVPRIYPYRQDVPVPALRGVVG